MIRREPGANKERECRSMSGTRSRQWLAALVGLAFFAVGSAASANSYVVLECKTTDPQQRTAPDYRETLGPAYAKRNRCEDNAQENAMQIIPSDPATPDTTGRVYLEAPPTTKITSVQLDAKLRKEEDHRARVYVSSSTFTSKSLIHTGESGASSFVAKTWSDPAGKQRLVLEMSCDGSTCPAGSNAKAYTCATCG